MGLSAAKTMDFEKESIPTPALMIDLDVMERNIEKMSRIYSGYSADLRPHFKTHKCPVLAHKQVEQGAVGMTCAKMGEAEVLVGAGIKDVLVANQVVTSEKIARLVHLNAWGDVKAAVDNAANVRRISQAAGRTENEVGLLIEVEVGNNRAGALNAEEALQLAQIIEKSPGVILRGVMGYEGHAVLVEEYEKRRRLAEEAMGKLLEVANSLRDTGFEVDIVSAGGTGTYDVTGSYPGVTEVQVGSYILMDARYGSLERLPFENALTLLSTITSRPTAERAIADAGRKSLALDFGLPSVMGSGEIETVSLSEEHAKLRLKGAAKKLEVGETIEFLPTHVCTNMDLHDRVYGLRGNEVEVLIEVAARGKFV